MIRVDYWDLQCYLVAEKGRWGLESGRFFQGTTVRSNSCNSFLKLLDLNLMSNVVSILILTLTILPYVMSTFYSLPTPPNLSSSTKINEKERRVDTPSDTLTLPPLANVMHTLNAIDRYPNFLYRHDEDNISQIISG